MKNVLTASLLFLICANLTAQNIRIESFRENSKSNFSVGGSITQHDWDGNLCAKIIITTEESGWTFEPGLDGIVDIQYSKNIIYLFLPASTTELTVAHKKYGILKGWKFPLSLREGASYCMKLHYLTDNKPITSQAAKTPKVQVQPKEQLKRKTTRRSFDSQGKNFCNHFIDMYAGMNLQKSKNCNYRLDDCYLGMQYTWLKFKYGTYGSVAFSSEGSLSCLAGVALRLTDQKHSTIDCHMYGGLGIIDYGMGGEIGIRLAWLSDKSISRWDFGIGCQIYKEGVMPTVSVGLCIWGIPICIGLGLLCYAM